jgi:hypothetical protein
MRGLLLLSEVPLQPLSSELGTNKTVGTRFWSSLSGENYLNILSFDPSLRNGTKVYLLFKR